MTTKAKAKEKKEEFVHAVGRRKTAVARVYLRPREDGHLAEGTSEAPSEGQIVVNRTPFDSYFGRAPDRWVALQSLNLLERKDNFDIIVNVRGGGKSSQAGAVRHAMARALCAIEADDRSPLKAAGFLTRDPREVERKKYGLHKARKRPQFSKR